MSGPSLAGGKVQNLPPPSQGSHPLLNLHFENFPWTGDLQTTAAHPPSLPLPVQAAPPTGPSLPISSALFTLGARTSYSEPVVQLLPPASCSHTRDSISCLFFFGVDCCSALPKKRHLKACGTIMWGHQKTQCRLCA